MDAVYRKDYHVGPGDTDPFGYCRASALQAMFQDVASEHADSLAASREALFDALHAAWILVRFKYRLFRPVRFPETLTASTWTFPPKGVFFLREFDLHVGEERVGEATSKWIVADVETRKILRPDRQMPFYQIAQSAAPREEELSKLSPPGPLSDRGTYTVRYSDLDMNCHMNNVRYVDIICDALALEGGNGAYVSEIQINYAAECRAGETIALGSAEAPGGQFVRGTGSDGAVRFDALVSLSAP
ncbi:acyl-ACP thioesterase [Oscillospiraceae bacterium OttesenSCG-928-G22]|nr:acyl-ACP thioesterase [Oscillospiraceae bacterium OttesenSCG-928-G22]